MFYFARCINIIFTHNSKNKIHTRHYLSHIIIILMTVSVDFMLMSFCQDAYENELENMEEHVTAMLGEDHAGLYPLITKLVIASCQMTKH